MWFGGKESILQCRRLGKHGFDPGIGKILWRRKWQPTPVFLPGKSHGQKRLAGYSPQGCKALDMIQQLNKTTSYGKPLSVWLTGSLICQLFWENSLPLHHCTVSLFSLLWMNLCLFSITWLEPLKKKEKKKDHTAQEKTFCHEKSIKVFFSTSNYKYRETLELGRLESKSCLCFLKISLLYIYPPHG